MEEAVMRTCSNRHAHAGFSLVEFLIAALIMGIGLLGLATLEVMSLKTATNGKSLSNGVTVAESMMEAVGSESRQRYLTRFTWPQVAPPSPRYFAGGGATVIDYFDRNGTSLASATGAYYTVTTQVALQESQSMADQYMAVATLTYNEDADPTHPGNFIVRQVELRRHFAN
jgi:prepilin-type N-terminal cleavage/methylation domain-containing protein